MREPGFKEKGARKTIRIVPRIASSAPLPKPFRIDEFLAHVESFAARTCLTAT